MLCETTLKKVDIGDTYCYRSAPSHDPMCISLVKHDHVFVRVVPRWHLKCIGHLYHQVQCSAPKHVVLLAAVRFCLVKCDVIHSHTRQRKRYNGGFKGIAEKLNENSSAQSPVPANTGFVI